MESMVSRSNATRAGAILAEAAPRLSDEYQHALEIAEQWRMQHVEPTRGCFQSILFCSHHFPDSTVTYRAERMVSIRAKLTRASSHFELDALDEMHWTTPEDADSSSGTSSKFAKRSRR